MKAIIVHNVSQGQVMIKSKMRGAMPVTVSRGASHMFDSYETFLSYQDNVERLVASKSLKLEEVKAKAVEQEYERPTLVDYDRGPERDVIVVREDAPVAQAKSKEELKKELVAAQDAYRAEKDSEKRPKLKEEILAIKELIKKA